MSRTPTSDMEGPAPATTSKKQAPPPPLPSCYYVHEWSDRAYPHPFKLASKWIAILLTSISAWELASKVASWILRHITDENDEFDYVYADGRTNCGIILSSTNDAGNQT